MAIASLLGLAVPEPQIPTRQEVAVETAMDPRPLPGIAAGLPAAYTTLTVAPITSATVEAVPVDPNTPSIPASLTRIERVQMDASLKALDNIPADPPAVATPEIRPLFAPLQTRSILSGALARIAETGPLDLDPIIRQCARGDILARLPRFRQAMLSSGVQVLVDRGDAMTVFAQDQARLEAAIRILVGKSKIRILSFEGFPSRAGSGGKRLWKLYEEQLPPPGTVVALLTDLGIGRAAWLAPPAPPKQWRTFADRLSQRGCPVVAFVPYPPSRWPVVLKHAITIIQWDRTARASSIRAAAERGLRAEN